MLGSTQAGQGRPQPNTDTRVQVFCHHTRKDLRARKDLTKYSEFVKAKVTMDDLREWDTPMGSGWKVFIKSRGVGGIGWFSGPDTCEVTVDSAIFVPPF